MINDDNIVVEPKKPGQILYKEVDFVKFMNSPRFKSFMDQADTMLKENTFLFDEKVVVQGADNSVRLASSNSSGDGDGDGDDDDKNAGGQKNSEDENAVLDLMSSVATAALGVVFKDKDDDDDEDEKEDEKDGNEKDGDEKEADDGGDGDDDGDGDDEELTEEEKSDIKEIATPIIAAMSKSLVKAATGMVNKNSASIVEKLTPVVKDLAPFFKALKPGIKYIQGPVETVLAPLNKCLGKYGIDVNQIKTDLTPVCNALAITTMMGGSSRVAQLKYDYRTRFRDIPDLNQLWDPAIPLEERVPRNEGDPTQKKVFKHMADTRRPEEKLNKIDCLNQLIVNLNVLKEPIKKEEMDEEFILRQVNRRHQAFKNLNYLYFKFNALASDETDPENVRNSANYNQTTYRWTQDGKELFFVVGKFLQDAFNYNEVSVDDERAVFDNAEKWYDEARKELFGEYGRQFFENKFVKYSFDPEIMKKTADISYEKPEVDVEWDTPDKKRPGSLDAFGDNWEISVPDMIHHPELFIDDEIEVDDPDAPGEKKKEAVPCGMTVLINQIEKNIEAENAMFSGITGKVREDITARMNDTITIRQSSEKQTYDAADAEQKEIGKRLSEHNAGLDFSDMEEQVRFNEKVNAFKTSFDAMKDSDAKQELAGFMEKQPGDIDFFASDDERYFNDKSEGLRALIEKQQKKIDELTAELREKEDQIGKLDGQMNDIHVKNTELSKKVEMADRGASEMFSFLQKEKANRSNFDYKKFPDTVLTLVGLTTLKSDLSKKETIGRSELYNKVFDTDPLTGKTNQTKLSEAASKLEKAVNGFKKIVGEKAEEMFFADPFNLLEGMRFVQNLNKSEEELKNAALLDEMGEELLINQTGIAAFKDQYVGRYDALMKRDGNVNAFLPENVQGSPELSELLKCVNEYSDAIKPFRETLVRKDEIRQEVQSTTEKAFVTIDNKIRSLDRLKKEWNDEIARNREEELKRADSEEMHKTNQEREKALAEKKELDAKLADRNAELKSMNEVNALLAEGSKLAGIKREKDPCFQDKKRYAELTAKKQAAKKEMDRIRADEEKKTEPLLAEDKVREKINAVTEKHNAKIEKLNKAKAEYGRMKAQMNKFWEAEKKLSRTGIVLGRAKEQLAAKAEIVEAQARLNRPNKQVMKDFDDRQRAIMEDLVTAGKFWGFLVGDSQEYKDLQTAVRTFMDDPNSEFGSRTNAIGREDVDSALQRWNTATAPVMEALKTYIKSHDVTAPGKTKWTNSGQQRLDAAKQLKQIIDARTRTLEADSAELQRLRDMKDGYIRTTSVPEALVQLTVQKNRNTPALSLSETGSFLKNTGVYGISGDVYDPKKNIAGKAAIKLDKMYNDLQEGKRPGQPGKKQEEPEKVQEQLLAEYDFVKKD